MDNPAPAPITANKPDQVLTTLRKGLPSTDQQLINRLEKLKEGSKGPPPTESELRARLAALKGENNYVEGPSKPVSKNILK